jgi:hypothetical protein
MLSVIERTGAAYGSQKELTDRIFELLTQSARVTLGRQTEKLSLEDRQHAGKFCTADTGSERNVSH